MDYATALQQFPALRQQANEQMTTPRSAPQAPTVDRWPGLLNPGKVAEWAAGKMPDMPSVGDTTMAKYLRNSIGALGRAPGDIAEMSPMDMAKNAFAAASAFPTGVSNMAGILRNAHMNPEVARGAVTGNWEPIKKAAAARDRSIMRAPPHTLQKRGPDGRFQSFDAETRKIRDQAIKDRARQKLPGHQMEYDDFGEPLGSKAARDYLSKI
jgi:hypothetical protein